MHWSPSRERVATTDERRDSVVSLPPGDAGDVARSIAASLESPQSDAEVPEWLREDQRHGVRRLMRVLEHYGGALLADPTGSGKTYSALAVGSLWPGRGPLLALAPAALVAQWRRTARQLAIAIEVHSHELVSRGALPALRPRLVIVDESHWFRNPTARRYQTLAPFLVGRPVLLLSATPIVNRLSDLGHQLLLAVPDDSLAWYGVPSLAALFRGEAGHPALGELVITRSDQVRGRPLLSRRVVANREPDRPAGILAGLDRLALSTKPGTASILRGILYRAMESSPAALQGVLTQYQALLGHAADARAAGRPLDRGALRRFTAGADEQLVLWALLPQGGEQAELVVEDAEVLPSILQASATWGTLDARPSRLAATLGDGRITLVFTAYRETVGYLRRRLASLGPAWCTGDRAGIGHSLMARDDVLAWFSPERRPAEPGPRVLLTTDVSAEGLDLQLAERVVHYDLPWTSVGLAQREGRAARLGSRHHRVEAIRYQPSPEGEQRLHGREILTRKSRIPELAGLGEAGRWLFRWREELSDCLPNGVARPGVALVVSDEPGILVGLELTARRGAEMLRAATVGWLATGGEWTEAPEEVQPRLVLAASVASSRAASPQQITAAMETLRPVIAQRIRDGNATRWAPTNPSPGQFRLLPRLRQLIETAARALTTDFACYNRPFASLQGAYAGEAELILRLSTLDDATLKRALTSVPGVATEWEAVGARLTGILIFSAPHPRDLSVRR